LAPTSRKIKKRKNTALPDDESEDLRLKVIFKYSLINLIRRLDSTKAVACIGVAREEFVLDYKQKAEKGRRDEHSGRRSSVEALRIRRLQYLYDVVIILLRNKSVLNKIQEMC
jgi:hypothetical protein